MKENEKVLSENKYIQEKKKRLLGPSFTVPICSFHPLLSKHCDQQR